MAFRYIKILNTCTYFVYFKSKKELNHDIFVDPNILGAASYIRIYESIKFCSFSLTYVYGAHFWGASVWFSTIWNMQNNVVNPQILYKPWRPKGFISI